LAKAGRNLLNAVERGAVLWGNSSASTTMFALARLDGDGAAISVLEPAGAFWGRFPPCSARPHRELILLLTGDLPLSGGRFSAVFAHVVAVEGVPTGRP